MNQTENYSLPQWEATDRVTRESVNDAMAAIDAALEAIGGKPYVLGSYEGNDSTTRVINVGVRPSLVIIVGANQQVHDPLTVFVAGANSGSDDISCEWTDTGIIMSGITSVRARNVRRYTYHYIALR